MKELREMRQTVQSMPIAGDDKRDMLVEIGRMENNLVSNIGDIKKLIASMQ